MYAYMYILVNNPEMETSLSVYNISQVIMADKGPEISELLFILSYNGT